jgi:hypothetical protein
MREMKVAVVLICFVVFAQACAHGGKTSSAPSPQPSASENEMSPEFQEMGHRALDAILRLNGSDTGIELRKLDAEKAVDEAKYKARTAKDKEVLEVLRAAEVLTAEVKTQDVQKPEAIAILRTSYQCRNEAAAELQPANSGGTPTEKLCLEQLASITKLLADENKAWDERHNWKVK